MATLIATTSGSLSSGAIWAPACTGTGAQQLVPSTFTQLSSTANTYVWSPAFTIPNGDVIDAVVLCLLVAGTPAGAGTVTVGLSEDNGVTAAREVTVNVSDLKYGDRDFLTFQFASTLTSDGGADYKIGIKTSTTNTVLAYRSSTTADWWRLLRRSATLVTAAATDVLVVAGPWTAAGTGTDITVTMDGTSVVDYGAAWIGSRGILAQADGTGQAYVTQLSGDLIVGRGGTLRHGSRSARIPGSSTAKLQFNCTSDGQFGLICWGRLDTGGSERTSGTAVSQAKLAANASAAATALTLTVATGWKAGDQIGIASTSRTWTDGEVATLAADASGTALTLSAGLGFAHGGSGYVVAEVALLTRNVTICSASTAHMAYVYIGQFAQVDSSWTEYRYMGDATNHPTYSFTKYPIVSAVGVTGSVSGSLVLEHNLLRDCEDGGIYQTGSSPSVTIQKTTLWACGTVSQQPLYTNKAVGQLYEDIWVLRSGSGSFAWMLNPGTGIYRRITVASCNGYPYFYQSSDLGEISELDFHSNSSGMQLGGGWAGLVNGIRHWRCGGPPNFFSRGEVRDAILFGNATNNMSINAGDRTRFVRAKLWSESAFTTGVGLLLPTNLCEPVFIDSDLSYTGAGGIAHGTADISSNSLPVDGRMTLINTACNATTEVAAQSNFSDDAGLIASHNHDRVSGNHIVWKRRGRAQSDATIYETAAPSERLTPNGGAGNKLPSSTMAATIDSGAARTVSVKIRKSVAGDGAAYNGGQPRLILKRNDAIGVTSDTVLATASGAAGSWETLSAATPTSTSDGGIEVYVDCDGTTGWVNVDAWSVT